MNISFDSTSTAHAVLRDAPLGSLRRYAALSYLAIENAKYGGDLDRANVFAQLAIAEAMLLHDAPIG